MYIQIHVHILSTARDEKCFSIMTPMKIIETLQAEVLYLNAKGILVYLSVTKVNCALVIK